MLNKIFITFCISLAFKIMSLNEIGDLHRVTEKETNVQSQFRVNNEVSSTDSVRENLFNIKYNSLTEKSCNETQRCRNGGSCLSHVCVCLPGTSGPFCGTVIDCDEKMGLCANDFETYCDYDVRQQKAVCRCHTNEYRFDDLSRSCRKCCIGTIEMYDDKNYEYCEFQQGEPKCVCKEKYAYDPLQQLCRECYCGPDSDWCGFDEEGKRVCSCKEGFIQDSDVCRKCPCGEHGVCDQNWEMRFFYGWCTCDPGYAQYYGVCVDCSCGKYGQCVFDKNGTQVGCKCIDGYSEKLGVCEMCNCGENSNCSFRGEKKICNCGNGYEDINGFCTDINECEKQNPCKKSTRCINLLGGFKCVCDEGYYRVTVDPILEPFLEFCKDIDECKNSTKCVDSNSDCVNTPGSYECVCQSGYSSRGGTEQRISCEKTSRGSIYAVVFGTSLAVLALTAGVAVYAKRNLQRRRF